MSAFRAQSQILTLIMLSLFATACGEFMRFESSCVDSNCEQQSLDNDGAGAATQPDRPRTINDINMKGHLSGSKNNGLEISNLNINTREISLQLPVSGGAYLGKDGDVIEVPGNPDIKISLRQMDNDHMAIELTVPLHVFVNGLSGKTSSTLPNGKKLTNFKSGEHNYTEFYLGGLGAIARIYGGAGQLGFYLDLPFNPHIELNYPFINGNQELLGHLSQFPATDDAPGALFLSLKVDDSVVRIMQNSL